MQTGKRYGFLILLSSLLFSFSSYAQSPASPVHCETTAVPPQVHAEGLAEAIGDVILQCSSSSPGAVIAGNFTLSLPVSITNQIDASSLTTDAVLSVDYGLGFTPSPVKGLVSGNSISFNGVSLTVPAGGNFSLKFSNVRANVHQLGGTAAAPQPVVASLSVPLLLNQAQIIAAYAVPSLYATFYDKGITCGGSPLPATIDMADLFTSKTVFFSTRLTEGFGGAFAPQAAGATNGTRFLVTYTGFPANARLFVPDMVAGSNAATPTAGGDLGTPQAPGQYLPGSGTLLLIRVAGADATGTGGTPLPAPTGSNPVTLNSVNEVALTGGTGYVVYAVVDSSPTAIESAQFPTFIGLSNVAAPVVAQESVSLAPVSSVSTASATAPFPRFAAVTPDSDCGIVGDCGAAYFPKLSVFNQPVQLAAIAGGAMTSSPGYIYVKNAGGGVMNWTATIHYVDGSGWLTLYEPTTQNSATITVGAQTLGLAAGNYHANVVIDAGPLAGNATIPVTLIVQALPQVTPPSAPTVTVTSVVNAATFASTPLVPGSLATVMGTNLSGKAVSATFDSLPATLLYTSATQINLQLPAGLGSKSTATLVVTVDGVSSAPATVQLAPAWPAIFSHGVLDQNNQENTAGSPAADGTVLQVFATGIPAGATVTAQIGGRTGLVPLYAGPAPDVPGVQQVNVAVPGDLPPGATQLTLCAAVGGQQYCSPSYALVTD
jgi:uncharacterized protein (TIGR03437 family)